MNYLHHKKWKNYRSFTHFIHCLCFWQWFARRVCKTRIWKLCLFKWRWWWM